MAKENRSENVREGLADLLHGMTAHDNRAGCECSTCLHRADRILAFLRPDGEPMPVAWMVEKLKDNIWVSVGLYESKRVIPDSVNYRQRPLYAGEAMFEAFTW